MDEKNIREIAKGHGWPEDEFLGKIKQLVNDFGHSEDSALDKVQREYRLRRIAHVQGFNQDAFASEFERLSSEGKPNMDVLSQTMKLFEKGSHKVEKEPTLATFAPNHLEEPAPPPKPKEKPMPPKPKVEQKPKATSYDKLMNATDGHLCEIYGSYGTGKSRLVHSIAIEAQNAGKRVIYLDTEGGLTKAHIEQLKNYEYVGDELNHLIARVRWVKENRDKFDLLIVDSVGHVVYVNYVAMRTMDEKLKSYQELAAIFRDMVRFARGEREKDFGRRSALSIAVNHTVSEFAKISEFVQQHRPIPREALEQPLDPFGGQIHRVPKLILRSEPVGDGFRLITFKARDLPKNKEIARFTIDSTGTKIDWKI